MTPIPPQPERWLRGPVEGVSDSLQPVAHALLQSVEEVEFALEGLDRDAVWMSLGGAATIGFHLRHIAGSLDRLLSYARGEGLTETQRSFLSQEGKVTSEVGATELLKALRIAVDRALAQLRDTSTESLDEFRQVGRAGLPSSVRGLLYHAGEHTVRHAGQLLTTAKILSGMRNTGHSGEAAERSVVGPLDPGCYAVVFTSVRMEGDDGYAEMADRMLRLAPEQPGFLGVESVRDGTQGITVSYWTSEEAVRGWRAQVEHLEAQRLGRDRWYRSYGIHVARVERSRVFSAPE